MSQFNISIGEHWLNFEHFQSNRRTGCVTIIVAIITNIYPTVVTNIHIIYIYIYLYSDNQHTQQGYIVVGYRGTFAFGRDMSDVKVNTDKDQL